MGLDAWVYCNCYELGRLKEPPPPEVTIFIAESQFPYGKDISAKVLA